MFRVLLGHVREGVQLTAAGYLPPAVVTAIVGDLGLDARSAATKLRESDVWSVVTLREASTALGLTRKYRGKLLLTREGARLCDKPVELWQHIAGRLPLERGEHERRIATLLLLLVAAGDANPRTHLVESLDMMTAMIGLRIADDHQYRRARAIDVVSATDDVVKWVTAGSLTGYHFAAMPPHPSEARLMARAALWHESELSPWPCHSHSVAI